MVRRVGDQHDPVSPETELSFPVHLSIYPFDREKVISKSLGSTIIRGMTSTTGRPYHHSTGDFRTNDDGGPGSKVSVPPPGGSGGMAKKRNFSAPGGSGLARKQWRAAVMKIKNLTDPWKGYVQETKRESSCNHIYLLICAIPRWLINYS